MMYYKTLDGALTQLANDGFSVTFCSCSAGVRIEITDGTSPLVGDGETAQDAWAKVRDEMDAHF